MNYLDVDTSEITPAMLENIMLYFGWSKLKSFPKKADVWKSKDNTKKQWVPNIIELADYDEKIYEIINSIAESEKLTEAEVALQFKQLYNSRDLIQLRIVSNDVTEGNIVFGDGIKLFDSFKTLVNGAISEVSGAIKDVKDSFLNESILGQTAVGSYIINAYLPLLNEPIKDLEQPQLKNVDGSGIGRKINQTLINRLDILNHVLSNYSDKHSNEQIDALLRVGYTKKECESIESLFGKSGNRSWEIKVLWSGVLPNPRGQNSFVRFDKSVATNAHKITNKLKDTKLHEGVKLIGRVVGLKRDYDDKLGHVTIKTTFEKQDITISAEMDDNCYSIADKANDSKSHVTVKGNLIKAQVGKYTKYIMPLVTSIEIAQMELGITSIDK
ncbi:MAG: hypothetical protein ACJAXJ_002169 [Colwellia sp.]|jgi:hypothetical protein